MTNELVMWIENDEQLYRRLTACCVNLWRKRFAGTYDHARAPKLWRYLVDDAARGYRRECGAKVSRGERDDAVFVLAEDYKPHQLWNLSKQCLRTHGIAVERGEDSGAMVWVFADGDLWCTTETQPTGPIVGCWDVRNGLMRMNRNGRLVKV